MKLFLLLTAIFLGLSSTSSAQTSFAKKTVSCRLFSMTNYVPHNETFEVDVSSVAKCSSANETRPVYNTPWSARVQFNSACDKAGKETDDFIGVLSISSTDPKVDSGTRVSNLENDHALSRPKGQRLNLIGVNSGARSQVQFECNIVQK